MSTSTDSSNPQPLRIVIVGGVAGGASAAARARRVNAKAEITLLEKGGTVSFANCGIPYHLGGEIAQRKSLLVATPELFWNRFRIHVKTGAEVTRIDRAGKFVEGIDHGTNSPFRISYDRLILSTGAEPIKPDVWPKEANNVYQLWTLPDLDKVMAYVESRGVKRVAVVGGGFVGLEAVEQLHRRGIQVSLLERNPQVLTPLDPEMARPVEEEMTKKGIELFLGVSMRKMHVQESAVHQIELEDGRQIATEMVIVGAGVRPRTELAIGAGLLLGSTGGVAVNRAMQTSDPEIYAVGDMVEYEHGVLNRSMRVPLAGPANRAGRIAGEHAASGYAPPMGPVFGTAIVRVFGVTAACTGLNEKACKLNSIAYRSVIIQAPHHASYFPGAQGLTLKLLYRPDTGELLGAQCTGGDGVDKRVDVVATAMKFHGTIHDLATLDLAYAPPFGSAKDPIHMAAFAACNDLAGWPHVTPPDTRLAGLQVVDVRNASEREKQPLPGSIHIPVDELAQRWNELDASLPTVTVCHSGKRAHVAACWLRGQGFGDVRNLTGGMSIRKWMVKEQA